MTKPSVQSAKLDAATIDRLDRLVESVPLANRHAVHVACVRAGVDIFDGDKHVAHCLIVLAAPEGPFLRCIFKRRTAPRLDPPRDFAG